MKKLFTTLIAITITAISLASTLKQEMRMYSPILGDTVKYAIYLPTGYHTNDRSYPVFYLLHGYGDDQRGWSQQGDIQNITDRAVAQGNVCDMIIVMPNGKDHWYVNSYDGKVRYEDMFFEEFIPHIDATFRTRKSKTFRAVGGLSMGGQGALLYAVKHPDVFGTCGALSSALYVSDDVHNNVGWFTTLFERIYGKDVPNAHWDNNNVLDLVAKIPDSHKNAVKFWIDCGDDDFLYRGNMALHTVLRDKNIPHQFRVRDGAHTWNYWRSGIVDVLEFATKTFLLGQ